MKFTKEELAEKLNGWEYRTLFPNKLYHLARANNLVVVSGASDDLLEFYGAITDELGAWEGTQVYIVQSKRHVWSDEVENSKWIKATWCPKDLEYSWLITSEIPHAVFDIVEGNELYCRGIVFCLDDV